MQLCSCSSFRLLVRPPATSAMAKPSYADPSQPPRMDRPWWVFRSSYLRVSRSVFDKPSQRRIRCSMSTTSWLEQVLETLSAQAGCFGMFNMRMDDAGKQRLCDKTPCGSLYYGPLHLTRMGRLLGALPNKRLKLAARVD